MQRRSKLTVDEVLRDLKTIKKCLDTCRDKEETTIMIYAIYKTTKDNPLLDLNHIIEKGKKDWSDLY